MINVSNILENFEKNKNIIIELLVEEYGEQYRQLIIQRINSTYNDFSSTPEEDYRYVQNHKNEVDVLDRLLVSLRYKEYKKVEKESKEKYLNIFINDVRGWLDISDLNKIMNNKNLFLSLFIDDNFNQGYIDSFTEESNRLKNNTDIPDSIRENIIKDILEFKRICKQLEINADLFTPELIKKIIEYREEIKTKYQEYIASKSYLGKKIKKDVKKNFDFILEVSPQSYLYFKDDGASGDISDDKIRCFFVKLPIVRLINCGNKTIDVILFHELIHRIEKNNQLYTGIRIHSEDINTTINEVRTQKLAIKLAKKLHDKGIFIYDNPSNYLSQGQCLYETMFPITDAFLDLYEDVLLDCSINNTPHKLDEYFGESWKSYSKCIDKKYSEVYYSFVTYKQYYEPEVNNEILYLVNEMNYSFNKGGKKNV